MATGNRLHSFFQVGINGRVIQNRLGVHTNVVVDDELEASQAHTRIGQLRKIEGQLGIAHVHHDFGFDLGQHASLDFTDFCFEQAIVNVTGIAFGTADGNQSALFQLFCGVAAAHHGRNTQLSRDDGSVASATATVGDNGAGTLHHGFPVRIGHVGHQHVAGLNLVHLTDVMHQAHRARTNLLTNRPALGQDGAFAFELVAQFGRSFGLALHGFRAGLQDIEQTIGAVFAPLDVHRAAIVLLDDHGITGQLLNLVVSQAVAVAQFGRHIGGFDQLAQCRFFFLRGKHHLNQFRAQIASDDTALARSQHGFVHIELVRINRALHHGLTQTIA